MADQIMIHPLTEAAETAHVAYPPDHSPEAWYAELTSELPEPDNRSPREIAEASRDAAGLAHEYGYIANGWIIASCAMLVLADLPGGGWVAIVFILIFYIIGHVMLRHARRIGFDRLALVLEGRLTRAAVVGCWTTRERIRAPGSSSSETVYFSRAAILYPDEAGTIQRKWLQMKSNAEFEVGDTLLLLHPPGESDKVRRGGDELTGGMRFTEAGELEIDEKRIAFAGKFNRFRHLAIQLGFGLAGLIIVIRLILLLF